MSKTRDDLVGIVQELVGRSYTGSADTIHETINTGIELFGNVISAIYDESEYEHTFSVSDTTDDKNNYRLPSGTKYILDATVINPANEDTFYTMEGRSPLDSYKIDHLDSRRHRPGFYTGSVDISSTEIMTWNTFRDHASSAVGRVDQEGIPRWYWRVANNIYIFPRNSSNEQGWKLRLLLAMKPPLLVTNTNNTITDNYPYALAHFAAGLFWATRMGDANRANNHYTVAGQLLAGIASDQEISKLMGIKLARA